MYCTHAKVYRVAKKHTYFSFDGARLITNFSHKDKLKC